jgi:hypothetical protein
VLEYASFQLFLPLEDIGFILFFIYQSLLHQKQSEIYGSDQVKLYKYNQRLAITD